MADRHARYVPVPSLEADRSRVQDCLDHLVRSFSAYIDDPGPPPLPYMDAFMAAHNFHKLIVQDLIEREGLRGAAAVTFLRMALATFEQSIDVLIDKHQREA